MKIENIKYLTIFVVLILSETTNFNKLLASPPKIQCLKSLGISTWDGKAFNIMAAKINFELIKGQKYGRLTIISEATPDINKQGFPARRVECLCECGNYTNIKMYSVTKGLTKSCGCLLSESSSRRTTERNTKHGKKGTPEYSAWLGVKRRCYSRNHDDCEFYIDKGITVCDRWLDKDNGFLNFLEDMGERPSNKHSIDRINNDGNYEPSNCRWATATEQIENRSISIKLEHNGKIQSIRQWSIEIGISAANIQNRIYALGWSTERALTEPINKKNVY